MVSLRPVTAQEAGKEATLDNPSFLECSSGCARGRLVTFGMLRELKSVTFEQEIAIWLLDNVTQKKRRRRRRRGKKKKKKK